MKNACAISSLARQLGKVSEKLDSLAMGVQDVEQNAPDLTDVYQGLLLDEIEHVQILTLELTKAVVAAAEAANDPVWRWKMTAGFASLAAVGVMAWSLLGQQPAAPGAAGALLATGGSSATAPAAAMPQQDVTVAGLQAQPDASALYPAEQSMRVSASADDGYATDSASYAEALMLAHSQLGENPLLQDALLTGQDE